MVEGRWPVHQCLLESQTESCQPDEAVPTVTTGCEEVVLVPLAAVPEAASGLEQCEKEE